MKHETLINQLNRQIEYPNPSDNEKTIGEYLEAVKDLSRIEQLEKDYKWQIDCQRLECETQENKIERLETEHEALIKQNDELLEALKKAESFINAEKSFALEWSSEDENILKQVISAIQSATN